MTSLRTFCCRICEKEIELSVLKDHSNKCKQFYDLLSELDSCNTHLLARVNDAVLKRSSLRKKLALRLNRRSENVDHAALEKMSEQCKTLKHLEIYRDKMSNELFQFNLEGKLLLSTQSLTSNSRATDKGRLIWRRARLRRRRGLPSDAKIH